MVTFVMFWLNSFLPKGGVSRIYIPRTIVISTTVSQRLHCRLPFGSYAEVHDNPSPSNLTNIHRTTPALCLGPTGNERGTYLFFSLTTGAVLRRYQWEELPITPTIVDRVHDMASCDRQADGLAFRDRTGTLLEQVDPGTFETLTSFHGATALNRPGVALARNVPLSADLFFINKVVFFVARSRRLQFGTDIATTGTTKSHLVDNLSQVVKLYNCFGFRVRTCFADGQFDCLHNEVKGVGVDTSGHNKHVGDIERLIHVIEERVRSIRAGLPFRRLPRWVLIKMVTFVMFWFNSFSPKGGVSRIYSPCTIVMGTTVSQRLHCRLPFGSYAEVHDNPSPSNLTNIHRTTPALCLGPTGNERGTYLFFSLTTGAVLRRYQWEELPITPTILCKPARGESPYILTLFFQGP